MSRTSKTLLIGLALAVAALLGQQPAQAQPKPSSEVLLPYFEVDLAKPTGVTTMFAIGNAENKTVEAEVAVYTNWGIPIVRSTLSLTPNQVRSFDLRDWVSGTIAGKKLSKIEQQHLRATLVGQKSPKDNLYYSSPVGTNIAVGYVRIRALGNPQPDALWGDYFLLDGTKTFGEGDILVNLDQGTGCPGACDRHALRFLNGGAFDGGTQIVIWNDVQAQPSRTPSASESVQADALAYDEDGQPLGNKELRLLPLQVVSVADLGLTKPYGWLDFQTETQSVMAVHHSSKAKFGIALQSYCLSRREVPEPGLRLRKLTNGEDANTEPGPKIRVGNLLLWEYIVENSGGVRLTEIEVTDNKNLDITCPKTALDPGESMTCTARGVAEACQYENIGTATGKTPDGSELTASDPSHYFGDQNAAIDIEKLVNGNDADSPPGPSLEAGSDANFTYIVTNTGDVALAGIKVTDDDKTLAVKCPKTSLRPAESMTCTATGKVQSGQYRNLGTATGTAACGDVTDTDITYYTGTTSQPGLTLVKLTNDSDVALAPGRNVAPGSEVTWKYLVTNTGQVRLDGIQVTDDPEGAVSCPKTSLQPNESMTCTKKGVAKACQYSNKGTATATSANGKAVTPAADWSWYYGETHPALKIKKTVNGDDANSAPGPEITFGAPVTWAYTVTNTGDTVLSNVQVTDNKEGAITCPKSSLNPGESMTCTKTGTAGEGLYSNIGTATGQPACGNAVSASDAAYYTGKRPPEEPGISLEKKTNSSRCTNAPGNKVKVGSQITWEYTVKNTGKVALNGIQVTDDKEGAISCPKTSLQPGESMTCSKKGVAQACQYSNKGTVTATSSGGKAVTASDMSWYFGETNAAVKIKKAVNGDDANSSPGPYVTVGSPVTWTYTVTNTGDTVLSGVQVTDNKEGAITCPKNTLNPNESMTCTETGVAIEGSYYNVGTVTAQPPCGNAVSSSDGAYYTGKKTQENPAISLAKTTNSSRCYNAPGNKVKVGSQITWEYAVKNIGDVRLDSVQVSDDKEGAISCPKTSLQPGESMTCSKKGVAQACQYSNKGTVTATSSGGKAVTASDMSWYFGETNAAVKIKKSVNGDDANSSPGPSIAVGSAITWTWAVTNTGDTALSNVQVTDDKEGAVSCPKNTLNPNESMTCTKTGAAVEGQYYGTGTVTAQPLCGNAVSASDKAYYKGVPQTTGGQGCSPGYWKNHSSSCSQTGYSSSQKVKTVFDKAWYYPSLGYSTLQEALSFNGGSGTDGAAATLLRSAVAAIFNASHPSISYPRSAASVISDVNAALASKNRDQMLALASALDSDNNLSCPLN